MAKEEAARCARSDGRAKVAERPLWPRRRLRAVRRTCQGRGATVMAKEEAARCARSDGRAKVAERPLWPASERWMGESVVWLLPTLFALLIYGIGQGLVKQYSVDVP